MVIALLGNPNVGKTTLFNELTGSNQYVGNWPGVTVEKKRAGMGTSRSSICPGSMPWIPIPTKEKVSKNFLLHERPDLIVNIVDASNLSRNLYLTAQAGEFGIPMILALNMLDMAHSKGIQVDPQRLSDHLGIPVVPVVAAKSTGIPELIRQIRAGGSLLTALTPLASETETYARIDAIVSESQSRESRGHSFSERFGPDRSQSLPGLSHFPAAALSGFQTDLFLGGRSLIRSL